MYRITRVIGEHTLWEGVPSRFYPKRGRGGTHSVVGLEAFYC